MVFISNGRTTCFGLQRPSSGFDNFLAKRVLAKNSFSKKVVKTWRWPVKAETCSFYIANEHHHLAIFIAVFLAEFTSPYSLNAQQGWHTSEFKINLILHTLLQFQRGYFKRTVVYARSHTLPSTLNYRATGWTVWGSNPGRGQRFFLSPKPPNPLYDPPTGFIPGTYRGRGAKLTTQHAFIWSTWANLQFLYNEPWVHGTWILQEAVTGDSAIIKIDTLFSVNKNPSRCNSMQIFIYC